jgi:hypothetical protein
MVLSLLDNGFEKQDVAAALDRLADEARRDVLEKALESRKRARGVDRSNQHERTAGKAA